MAEGSSVDELSEITRSVIGKNCKIGKNVKINDSYILPDTVIKDDCIVSYSFVGEACILGEKSILSEGCILGSKVHIKDNGSFAKAVIQSEKSSNCILIIII